MNSCELMEIVKTEMESPHHRSKTMSTVYLFRPGTSTQCS